MEQLRTWSAEGTLVMEGFWPKPDGGEPRRLRRHARFEFDIDFGKQRVYSGWHETQPVEVIGPGRKDRQLLSSNLFRQRCVLTPSRWLDLQAARFIDQPRPAVFSYNGSRLNVVVQEKSNPDRNHMRVFHMMIDPRDWFGTSMGSVRVPNNLFWDEVTWLKDYRQKAVKEGKKEPINRFLGVRRRDGRDGFFVTASRLFFQGNVPDAKVSEVREMDFSERASFLMTRCLYRTGEGRSKEESRITHSKVNGVFVPTKYRYTQFDNKGKPSRTLTVSLTKSRVNHEIGDERFTAARFDLKDGDRMRNREANAFYEWKDGAFEEIDPPKRPSSMEWNRLVSTDLRVRTHAGTEWNTLLRDWIEVWNVRDNPKRHADIARRYVALARNADDADLAFRSLEQVIKSEFAGPASVDAADMIVRDHLKHARLPAIIGDLQIGVPPSIASDRLLRGIIRESTNDNLKARACYELAKFLHRQSNRIRMLKALPARTEQIQAQYGDWYLKRLNGIEPGRIEAEAETVLKQVIDEFPNQITRDSKPLGPLAKSLLFHVRNLSIGRKALPIEGRDVDGNPMRLSDYPNRVRVLMFWGHWARRTHKVYPLYRELIEKNRSEPFEFLGMGLLARWRKRRTNPFAVECHVEHAAHRRAGSGRHYPLQRAPRRRTGHGNRQSAESLTRPHAFPP